jgi:hypothetical protein
VILGKDGLGLVAATPGRKSLLSPNANSYVDGTIKPEFPSLLQRMIDNGSARIFSAGETVWITKSQFNNKGSLELELISDPIDGTIYWGTLKFPAPKGSQPDGNTILAAMAEAMESEDSSVSGTQSTAGNGRFSNPVSSTSKANLAAVGPPLDVAGVRLGMTPDEAIAALKKFANWPLLKKRYTDNIVTSGWMDKVNQLNGGSEIVTFGDLGFTDDCTAKKNVHDRVLVTIIAAMTNRSECSWASAPISSSHDSNPLEVTVFFSPTPGSEHVIGVSLWSAFGQSPLVQTVKENALQKYGPEYSASFLRIEGASNGSSRYITWRYDSKGKLITSYRDIAYYDGTFHDSNRNRITGAAEQLTFALRGSDRNTPILDSINRLNGVGLDFIIEENQFNRQLALSYSVALFNEKELYAFTKQQYDSLMAMQDMRKNRKLIRQSILMHQLSSDPHRHIAPSLDSERDLGCRLCRVDGFPFIRRCATERDARRRKSFGKARSGRLTVAPVGVS